MKNFSFIKNQKIFFTISIIVLIIGIVSFFIRGFNFDIDFIGGTEVTYNIGSEIPKSDEEIIISDIKSIIGADKFSSLRVSGNRDILTVRTLVLDEDDNSKDLSDNIKNAIFGLYTNAVRSGESTDSELIFRLASTEENEDAAFTEEDVEKINEKIAELTDRKVEAQLDGSNIVIPLESSGIIATLRSEITEAVVSRYPDAKWVSTDTVSAEVSSGLKKSAIIATCVAVFLMLVYIAFRFQISSAFAAIVCLTHDIFVMVAAYSLLQLPVNSTIIAALLTILGYSINATLIIFDKIRENDKKMSGKDFAEKVDEGIKGTLWRSINTTVTTLFTVGMIYILGVTSIKNFALPLIVGIIAGLYSSVCLSGPLWNLFKNIGKKIKK
ncbi:MAG: protein translocase subunit SecF [Clostridia bacterium]|nr:protein translocase subunit SecF [Clostridia bacterium]